MADFGPRMAISFWLVSVTCQVLFTMGIVNYNFMSVWTLATIADKTLKLLSEEREAAFLAWADRVLDSMFSSGEPESEEVELPIFRPHRE